MSVFVVEDDKEMRRFVAWLLTSRTRHDVFCFESAEEALQELELRKPSLLLTDLGLPGLSGEELAQGRQPASEAAANRPHVRRPWPPGGGPLRVGSSAAEALFDGGADVGRGDVHGGIMRKIGIVSRVVGAAGFVAWLAACGGSALGPAGPTSPGGMTGGDVVAQGVQPLVGTWKAVSVRVDGAETIVPESVTLTAEFAADGRLSLVADCNRCAATYSATPGTLSVTPMACTRAYCPSAPLDDHFSGLVSAATSWTATAHTLDLELPHQVPCTFSDDGRDDAGSAGRLPASSPLSSLAAGPSPSPRWPPGACTSRPGIGP